ncbi:hypothetical protein [Bradyrhizobium neotropicale]|uniref:hypothetical protein n=1 Tax=Bradyrhizobium neotropicale TaxID=1497615 RepID=UPI001AD71895|nr:hypothetical protein [Bradyrhizobium neotropicale]MBO4226128.1 hypothetical protein [Bradyrhizobium neotropicale]
MQALTLAHDNGGGHLGLSSLPPELPSRVADHMKSYKDVIALNQTNRAWHAVMTDHRTYRQMGEATRFVKQFHAFISMNAQAINAVGACWAFSAPRHAPSWSLQQSRSPKAGKAIAIAVLATKATEVRYLKG